MATERELLAAAQEYCRANLKACCQEMIDFSKTGILVNVHVRHLARMVSFAGHASLTMAQDIVKFEAMSAISKGE